MGLGNGEFQEGVWVHTIKICYKELSKTTKATINLKTK